VAVAVVRAVAVVDGGEAAAARPANCWCEARMPVSMMYACTPAPLKVYVYVPLRGRLRWSMRSMPQVAPDCVATVDRT
jgi:hypothetical protein